MSFASPQELRKKTRTISHRKPGALQMRARLVIGAISKLNFFIGLTMLAPLILAWADGGRDAKAIATSMLITLLISGIMAAACRGEKQDISHKEGMLIVAAGWLSVGIFGRSRIL